MFLINVFCGILKMLNVIFFLLIYKYRCPFYSVSELGVPTALKVSVRQDTP
jgi:hypothetical protein